MSILGLHYASTHQQQLAHGQRLGERGNLRIPIVLQRMVERHKVIAAAWLDVRQDKKQRIHNGGQVDGTVDGQHTVHKPRPVWFAILHDLIIATVIVLTNVPGR